MNSSTCRPTIGTSRKRWLAWTALACAVAWASATPAARAATVFTLQGSVAGFLNTGVDLEVGRYVWINATGAIVFGSGNRATDPNGYGGGKLGTEKPSSGVPVPGAVFGSLVGRIGTTLVPQGVSPHTPSPGTGFVGSTYLQPVLNSGRLSLAYNDGGVSDNSGSFDVTISPTFTVQGNRFGFQDTGIDVNEGDALWMTTTGNTYYSTTGFTDADGFGTKNGRDFGGGGKPASAAVFGSLVGKVGNTLLPEGDSPHCAHPGLGYVGSQYAGIMPTSGRLSLAYNDGGVGDNSGTFDVAISPYFVLDAATESWHDTGIDLVAGQTLSIEASGLVRYAPDGRSTDPNGFGGDQSGTEAAGPGTLAPDAIFGALVGRIGSQLAPEGDSPYTATPGEGFIGSSYRQVVSSSGRLYLGYNDLALGDNGGYYLVRINVVPEPSAIVLVIVGLFGLVVALRGRFAPVSRRDS